MKSGSVEDCGSFGGLGLTMVVQVAQKYPSAVLLGSEPSKLRDKGAVSSEDLLPSLVFCLGI